MSSQKQNKYPLPTDFFPFRCPILDREGGGWDSILHNEGCSDAKAVLKFATISIYFGTVDAVLASTFIWTGFVVKRNTNVERERGGGISNLILIFVLSVLDSLQLYSYVSTVTSSSETK